MLGVLIPGMVDPEGIYADNKKHDGGQENFFVFTDKMIYTGYFSKLKWQEKKKIKKKCPIDIARPQVEIRMHGLGADGKSPVEYDESGEKDNAKRINPIIFQTALAKFPVKFAPEVLPADIEIDKCQPDDISLSGQNTEDGK